MASSAQSISSAFSIEFDHLLVGDAHHFLSSIASYFDSGCLRRRLAFDLMTLRKAKSDPPFHSQTLMSKKKGRTQIRVRPSLHPGLRKNRTPCIPITNQILS